MHVSAYIYILTVHLLDAVLIILGQFIILGYPLVPGIHESASNRAVRQTQRVTEFVRGYCEQTRTCKKKKRKKIFFYYSRFFVIFILIGGGTC